jgi:hypothetical protein
MSWKKHNGTPSGRKETSARGYDLTGSGLTADLFSPHSRQRSEWFCFCCDLRQAGTTLLHGELPGPNGPMFNLTWPGCSTVA